MSEGVSVIVPTFNRSALLRETLDALLRQTRQPDEIILVDDCSTDDTMDVARSYGPALTIIGKDTNQGKAHSINLAISQASHPLVWIVDDDDIPTPDALEKLLGLINGDASIHFAYGRHVRFSIDTAGDQHNLGTGYWADCSDSDFLVRTLEDFFVHQPGMIIRRSVIDEVGPLNEDLVRSQDYDFLIRLARISRGVGTNDVIFYQRQHDGMRGTTENSFPVEERNQKWIEYDQKIFRHLHQDMQLDEYLPVGTQAATEQDRRRALLQRGVIMARKKLWDLAVDDFHQAAGIGPENLSDEEIRILKRAFSSKYGCYEVVRGPFPLESLTELPHKGPAGKSIRKALAAGLRWRIRTALQDGEFKEAAGYLRVFLKLRLGV